jgi:hypothetical protein
MGGERSRRLASLSRAIHLSFHPKGIDIRKEGRYPLIVSTTTRQRTDRDRAVNDLPQLRADRAGYILRGESIDGFEDNPELSDDGRRRLATWAKAWMPSDLTEAQEALLATEAEESPTARELLSAAIKDAEEDLPEMVDFGLYDRLSPDQLLRVREPWRALSNREYPLGVHELAVLCAVTEKQVRTWENLGLLPSHRVGGRRQFFPAAAVCACGLRDMDPFEVAALAKVRRGDDEAVGFIQLLASVLARTAEAAEARTEHAESALRRTMISLQDRLAGLVGKSSDEADEDSFELQELDEAGCIRALGMRSLDEQTKLLVRPYPGGKRAHWIVQDAGNLQLASELTQRDALRVARTVLEQGVGGIVEVHPARENADPRTVVVGHIRQPDPYRRSTSRRADASRSSARGSRSGRARPARRSKTASTASRKSTATDGEA